MANQTRSSKKSRNADRKRARMAATRAHFESKEREEQPVYDRPVKVTDGSFQRLVLDSDVPVVVDFWASWCGPCRALAPSLEKVASAKAGEIRIVKYNTEQNSQYAGSLGIRSLPSLVMFKDGKVADKLVGAVPYNRLTSWIEGHTSTRRSLLGRLTGKSA